jgi:hypothetical protein
MNITQIDKMRKLQERLVNRSCTEDNLKTSLLLMEAAETIGNLLVSRYEWISVEDELPEIDPYGKGRYGGTKSVRVLCACKQRDGRTFVKEGYYEPCGNGHVVWRIPGSIDSVTHWMPLPEPPNKKEN